MAETLSFFFWARESHGEGAVTFVTNYRKGCTPPWGGESDGFRAKKERRSDRVRKRERERASERERDLSLAETN